MASRKRKRSAIFTVATLGLLAIAALTKLVAANSRDSTAPTFVLTGDILLSRMVEASLRRHPNADPWQEVRSHFPQDTIFIGNLEGAVGTADQCREDVPSGLCFPIDPLRIPLLKQGGFKLLSLENNHAFDLGLTGLERSRKVLLEAGLTPLRWEDSPYFLEVGPFTIAFVATNVFPEPGREARRANSREMRERLQVAGKLADLVVVYVHWGKELQDWAGQALQKESEALIESGADLVVGTHPHVVSEPVCVGGRPVYYSLGNHLFDQKYEVTWTGALLECGINPSGELVTTRLVRTFADRSTFFPQVMADQQWSWSPLECSSIPLRKPLTIDGITLRARSLPEQPDQVVLTGWSGGRKLWVSQPSRIISAWSARLSPSEPSESLVLVERLPSTLDNELAPRPRVYQVTARGLVARWRGTSLAWPLVDVAIIDSNGCVLCALHRGDSFMLPEPTTSNRRTYSYRWNGFGFDGDPNHEVQTACDDYWRESGAEY